MFKVATIMALFLSANFVFAHTEKIPSPVQTSAVDHQPPVNVNTHGRWLDESLDPWNTKDKRDHFSTHAIFGTAIELTFKDWSTAAKYGGCMVPGVLKEIYDVKKGPGGTASWRDLVANGLGCGIGIFGVGPSIRFMYDQGRTTIEYNLELK